MPPAHLAADDPLHLLVRGGRAGGEVGVGVADALGAGQVQAAGPAAGPGQRGVLDGQLVGRRARCSGGEEEGREEKRIRC